MTKTRRKADKVAKEVAVYLCVLHKISRAAATEKYSSTARRTKALQSKKRPDVSDDAFGCAALKNMLK